MPNCPFLAQCVASFEAARQDFETLVAGMDEEQARWRPEPGRWSVAECIEHLNVTARTYFPKMEGAIARGRERRLHGQAPYEQHSLLGRLILRTLDPGSGRKVRAPKAFRPPHDPPPFAGVCEEFRNALRRFIELATEADGLDLGRLRVASPVAPFPRMTLAEGFTLHTLHIRRHLAQAQAVTETAGYPRRR